MPKSKYRTVYILCPAQVRTGGPEALHQLARVLRDLGHDAWMVYVTSPPHPPASKGSTVTFAEIADPMPSAYQAYDVPHTFRVFDDPDNAVVIPETLPSVAQSFSRAKPHLWWLSIDNGLRAVGDFGGLSAVRAAGWVNMCQSYYALRHLADQDIRGLPLFDYTSPGILLAARVSGGPIPRCNRILYPARSAWFAGWLKRWAPDLQWQEIVGLSPEQAQRLFLTSKLYVDFGRHPGKDRMPREAAILGCCVITGRQGSAANPFDIPIPDRYKFRDSRLNIPRISRAIRTVLSEYDQRLEDFVTYRRIIAGEREEFVAQVRRIFEPGAWQE